MTNGQALVSQSKGCGLRDDLEGWNFNRSQPGFIYKYIASKLDLMDLVLLAEFLHRSTRRIDQLER